MANAGAVRAGEAFVEVTIRDRIANGLKNAQAKMAAFGTAVKSMGSGAAAAAGAVASTVGAVAAGIAALAVGPVAIAAKSLHTFTEISKLAKDTGLAIMGIDPGATQADSLLKAWKGFKSVIQSVGVIIGQALAPAAEKAIRFMTDLVVAGMSLAKNWRTVGDVAGNALVIGFQTAKLAIIEAFLDAFDMIRNASGQAVAFVSGSWNEFVRQFSAVWPQTATIASGAWTAITTAGLNALKTLTDASIKFFTGFAKAAASAFKAAVAIAPHLAGTVNGTVAELTGIDFHSILAAGERSRKDAAAGFVGHAPLDDSKLRAAQAAFNATFEHLRMAVGADVARVRNRLAGIPLEPDRTGSSAGAFGGSAGSLLGIGGGGGLKVKDEGVILELRRTRGVIEGLDVGGKFK